MHLCGIVCMWGQVLSRAQKRASDLSEKELEKVVSLPSGCWKPNESKRAVHILNTELSLQPQKCEGLGKDTQIILVINWSNMWEEKDGVTQYPTVTDFLRTTTPKLRFLPTLNSKLQVTQVTGLKKSRRWDHFRQIFIQNYVLITDASQKIQSRWRRAATESLQ